jgi:hypothetical protein
MRARIGIAMGVYWGGIVQFTDLVSTVSALGAIGGLPALLNALTKYLRLAIEWSMGRRLRPAPTPRHHTLRNKA